ncbi:glycosyl transferase [Pediococcus pentosaceus]|uniref:capsular polysaccharide synthesis protein n=1 Tax=Pediococcus pentosaceus TaxID=1255 RepID=UPI0018E18476|nr:capsular polysaccharide synthesis protein [Pediococcus pentosaceus]MBF7104694.1 glycosyl transferase [Pediococcus pentosaceus]QQC60868.1 glycosyl transferase [Pediococcus pentosaceus]
MKLFVKIRKVFKEQGGWLLVKQYRKLHVLLYAVVLLPFFITNKKGLEIYREAIDRKKFKNIKKHFLNKRIEMSLSPDSFEQRKETISNRPVWIMWYQGFDKAPKIVKNNLEILRKVVGSNRVITITEDNVYEYIKLPTFILEKYNKGLISKTHLSDLIRLELLTRYGGVWIDSTAMITSDKLPKYLEESDFFVPQILKPGLDGKTTFVSNWLIASKPNNQITIRLLDLLYTYWKVNDFLTDYFIFHKLLQIVFIENEEVYRSILPVDNSQMHSILISVLKDNHDEKQMIKQLHLTDFQKFSNKLDSVQKEKIERIQKFRMEELENEPY